MRVGVWQTIYCDCVLIVSWLWVAELARVPGQHFLKLGIPGTLKMTPEDPGPVWTQVHVHSHIPSSIRTADYLERREHAYIGDTNELQTGAPLKQGLHFSHRSLHRGA